jgi:hypothetical protein
VIARTSEWAVPVVGIAAIIIAGTLPPVREADAIIRQHAHEILTVTIGAAVAGLALLIGAWVSTARRSGRPMTHEEFEALSARTQVLAPGPRASVARFRGRVEGVVAEPPEWTFAEMKNAWRRGTWWQDPAWRAPFLGTAGTLLLTVGLFGSVSVPSPPGVKAVLAGAMLYALIRTAWGFWRA